MKFIILTPSAISGFCVLGEGETANEAWRDAYGPKPWPDYVKRSVKKAWVKQVTHEELFDLHQASRNR